MVWNTRIKGRETMKFTVDSKEFVKGLELISLKGKYATTSGFKGSKLSDCVDIRVDERVTLINADSATVVSKVVDADIDSKGQAIIEIGSLIKYLKKMPTATISVEDVVSITSGTRRATIPIVVVHPDISIISMLTESKHTFNWEEPVTFGRRGAEYSTAIQLSAETFSTAISSCEVVGSGLYKLDIKNGVLEISSKHGAEEYSEHITPMNVMGEDATVEFSAPIHNLFKDGIINIYFNDDSPITIISADAQLVRAPRITGR